jgi:Calcineurin-like phosphoesterase
MPSLRQGRRGLGPLFLSLAFVCLARLSPAADIPYEWSGVERVVSVADLHGDYDQFVFILAHPQVGLVDADLHWIGGKAHLVQLGDVLDRGTRAKEIFDLIRRLEKEAAAAGGMVHQLLGNHEEMNITGIALDYPGYVSVEQFVAFLREDFRREKDAEYIKTLPVDERKRAEMEGLDVHVDDGYAAYWQKIMAAKDPRAVRAYVLGFNDVYGDWLIKQNAVIKINDVIYVHGGINESFSKWPIREINQVLRTELEFFQGRMRNPQRYGKPFHPRLVYDPDSPLWFRGLATKNEATAETEIDRTLANLGARAMVVGHNYFSYPGGASPIVTKDFVARFHDKIWIMDTGISGSYGGHPSALVYDHGEFKVWGETEEVAARSGIKPPPPKPLTAKEMETFLRSAVVIGRVPGPGGRTDAWKLSLQSGDTVLPALFRYIDRRRPDPLADSFKYDLAAYALNKYLGLVYVPPIVERTVDNVPGALQAFIPNARSIPDLRERQALPPDADAFEKAMADLTVFQALVYDDCRSEKDTLVSGDNGQIYRVDFSEAFAPNAGEAPGCVLRRCSRLLYHRLLAWEDDTVAGYLGRYLNEDEIRALNTRRSRAVWRIRMMIKSFGESNVLF